LGGPSGARRARALALQIAWLARDKPNVLRVTFFLALGRVAPGRRIWSGAGVTWNRLPPSLAMAANRKGAATTRKRQIGPNELTGS